MGEMLPVTDILTDGQWVGRRCFLIGGGPSLRGFNWSLLNDRDELVIGCNRAYHFCRCDVVISTDWRFWRWFVPLDPVLAQHPCKVWSWRGEEWDLDGDVYANRSRPWAKTLEDGLGSGNSGFAALNLAWQLGAEPIYLLGYDCGEEVSQPVEEKYHQKSAELGLEIAPEREGGAVNFHDGYPARQGTIMYPNFKSLMETKVSEGCLEGREVINLGPRSTLECFPFSTIEEVLNGR